MSVTGSEKSIVFFVHTFPSRSESFVLNQIKYFSKKNFNVKVISIFPGEHIAELNEKYLNGVEVEYIFHDQSFKTLHSRIKNVFFSLYKLDVWRSLNFLKYGYLSLSLFLPSIVSQIKRKSKIDYIISHFATNGVVVNNLIKLGLFEGEHSVIIHGFDISNKEILKKHRRDYQKLFSSCNYIFPISNYWKKKLLVMGAQKDKVYTIKMGINTDLFKLNNNFKKKSPILKILTVARLTEKKGIDNTIMACALLHEKGIPFSYNVIGDGPLKEMLSSMVGRLKLENKINFYGAKDYEFVRNELMNSDVFVLPSKTASNGDMEGIPVSLMEAMAIGVPVVSSYHSGIPELITNLVTGFLVTENDDSSLAGILIDISKGKYDLELIRKNARDKVLNDYDESSNNNKLIHIITSQSMR